MNDDDHTLMEISSNDDSTNYILLTFIQQREHDKLYNVIMVQVSMYLDISIQVHLENISVMEL